LTPSGLTLQTLPALEVDLLAGNNAGPDRFQPAGADQLTSMTDQHSPIADNVEQGTMLAAQPAEIPLSDGVNATLWAADINTLFEAVFSDAWDSV
jgi:hypothetical protein